MPTREYAGRKYVREYPHPPHPSLEGSKCHHLSLAELSSSSSEKLPALCEDALGNLVATLSDTQDNERALSFKILRRNTLAPGR